MSTAFDLNSLLRFQVKNFDKQRFDFAGINVQVSPDMFFVQSMKFGHLLNEFQKS